MDQPDYTPNVLVLSTKFAKAHPEPANGVAVGYMPLGHALTVDHAGDAHFAAYRSPEPRRLSAKSVGMVPIAMTMLVADIDAPGHAGTDDWRVVERAKIEKLREVHPAVFVYETRGGYRILFSLAQPFPIASRNDRARWWAHYLAFRRYLARSFDIYIDEACKDWTRLYRLPRVLRDGKRETFPTYGDPDAIEALSIEAPMVDENRKLVAYVRTALDKAVEAVRSAPVGGRNEVLNREAYGLGGFAPEYVSRDEIFDKLLTAIVSNGGDPEVDARKIDAAIDAGMQAPRGVPAAVPAQEQSEKQRPFTDLGNAERFALRNGDKVRYCMTWDKWSTWDRRRWVVDDHAAVERLAKETVRSIYAEASTISDDGIRQRTSEHARKSESRNAIAALIALARSEPGIPVSAADLDRDPWLLNVSNGTIDLRTGTLRAHEPADLITKITDVVYDAYATAPRWEQFLAEVLPDPEVRAFLQRFIGYALTGLTNERAFAFLYGSGRNGKSILLRILRALAGEYGTVAAPDLLLAKRGESHPTEVADLFGARIAICSEVQAGRAFNEEALKRLTGDEPVKARRMREDFWEFVPTAKIAIAANHRPPVKDETDSIWDRICLIPFTTRIEDGAVDPYLYDKLVAELPGILAWAVRGCAEWRRVGLGRPAAVREATRDYRQGEDLIGRFVEECIVREPGAWATSAALHERAVRWSAENSEQGFTKRALVDRLKMLGLAERRTNTSRGWAGVRLRRPGDDDSDAMTERDKKSSIATAFSLVKESIAKVTSPSVTPSLVNARSLGVDEAEAGSAAPGELIEWSLV